MNQRPEEIPSCPSENQQDWAPIQKEKSVLFPLPSKRVPFFGRRTQSLVTCGSSRHEDTRKTHPVEIG